MPSTFVSNLKKEKNWKPNEKNDTSYIIAEGVKTKNPQSSFNSLLMAKFVKKMVDFDTHYCEL